MFLLCVLFGFCALNLIDPRLFFLQVVVFFPSILWLLGFEVKRVLL